MHMSSTHSGAQKRLISGIKPTGRLHIGNYFGALRQFISMQDTHDTFVFVADLHAITGTPSKAELAHNINEMILDYLGAGLDPKKVTLFRQSAVPAHTSLAWIFDCLLPVPYLERAHAYKDAQAKGREVNAGTFTYPVLMGADILMYDVDVVPVGKDQVQHVEYARDLATKFATTYEPLFKEPTAHIIEDVAVVPGTDGRKMSKSYDNTIPLFATDDEITKAVMSIPTDSRGRDEEKDPDELVLYQIHKLFNSSDELKAQYAKGLGYGDAKKLLINDIITFVTPMRVRRKKYEDSPKLVHDILVNGAIKANDIAMKKLRAVYEAVGLTS